MSKRDNQPGAQNAPRENADTDWKDLADRSLEITRDIEDLSREQGGNVGGVSDTEGSGDFKDIEPGDLGASTTASGIGEDDTGAGIGDTRLGAHDAASGFGEPRGRAEQAASRKTARGS